MKCCILESLQGSHLVWEFEGVGGKWIKGLHVFENRHNWTRIIESASMNIFCAGIEIERRRESLQWNTTHRERETQRERERGRETQRHRERERERERGQGLEEQELIASCRMELINASNAVPDSPTVGATINTAIISH